MLTRLKIKGFKNLVDVELRLGPLTVIAGPNGAGKSNLFDAIHFLSRLADEPFVEAASAVRGGADPRDLFTVGGNGRIELECDVIIPREGTDDFGQVAKASYTYLEYTLALRYEERGGALGAPRIALEHEQLSCIESDARPVGFEASPAWLASAIVGGSERAAFISTGGKHITLRKDRADDLGKKGGFMSSFDIERLPRTVLSSAQDAKSNPTAVLLRQELRSWRQLQLEPSALRRPDDFRDPPLIGASGAHVAAALHRLASASDEPEDVYAAVSNRLAHLVDGVGTVRVDRDEGRRLYRLMMRDLHGVELPASSLSDGTLRFIALAVMEHDPEVQALVCIEEPENGIHPQRVEAMLRLLTNMAADPSEALDAANSLRQVVVSTHSPVLVANASAEDVVFAASIVQDVDGRAVRGLDLEGLAGTWRVEPGEEVAKGSVLAYLASLPAHGAEASARPETVKDVMAREQQQLMRPREG